MAISDLLFEIYSAITANKIRSGLTMLGIIIGIGSVIAMISIGKGAQSSIEKSIESIGSNLITIRPGAFHGPGDFVRGGRGSAQTLTLEDSEAISKEVNGVKGIAPENSGNYQIISEGNNINASVSGTTNSYADIKNLEIEAGNFISSENENQIAKVAVIGSGVRDDLYGQDFSAFDTIGKKIKINGVIFTVVGTIASKGGTDFGSSDDMIYVPLKTAQQYLSGNDYLSSINIQVASQDLMENVQAEIENLLLERHNISDVNEADFNIMNQADIVETASSVTGTFTILLGSVAGISLVVGGIGIMNMMLTTVTERTREIGLRKAIGAKKSDISKQFLAEAIFLTFFGGVIGVILGWGIAFIVRTYFNLETEVSIFSVLLAFGVSTFIGIVFGYYPARRASRLNPIEALRYE